MIVEDNERNIKLLRDLLGAHGYRTIEARSAEDAIALVPLDRPELVLMDIQLPGMDGVAALRELRKLPETRAVPVIAVTAFAMKDDRERLLAAGFDGYLEKPIDVRALPAYVRSHLASTSAGAETVAGDSVTRAATILVVDDLPENVRLLDAVLSPRGYRVVPAASGEEALEAVAEEQLDLVLLDVVMPGMDGYEVCRRLRDRPATRFLPVVMITAHGDQEKPKAIEAGADDFLFKPYDQMELLARVRSLLRIKQYHDTIEAQAAELGEWNRILERRVREQIEELERIRRLKRFLPPQVVDVVVSSGDESFLEGHRREITVFFCDLRGFTPFAETVEPEELMAVLREYHAALGDLISRFEGTLERFTGDGLMVFFNDPLPCPDAPAQAVRMAVAMRDRVDELAEKWHRRGHDLHFGIGIAQGYATVGVIGFEERFDYAAIGAVTNFAQRLCSRAARREILVSQRVYAAIEGLVVAEPVGELDLAGFSRPMTAYNVLGLQAARAAD